MPDDLKEDTQGPGQKGKDPEDIRDLGHESMGKVKEESDEAIADEDLAEEELAEETSGRRDEY